MLSDTSIRRDGKYEFSYLLIHKIRSLLTAKQQERIVAKNRKLAENAEFTVFSNNCLGGFLYHDMGKQFTSPLINTAMDGEDFVKFLENPRHYLAQEMKFITFPGHDYPIAHLDDIEIRFVHYKTNEEAEEAFRKRAERIVWDKIFVVATNQDGLNTDSLLARFDKLPYHKLMYVSKDYPQYDWAVCVPQFKGRFQVRIMMGVANLKGQKYYETAFDPVRWILSLV